MTLEERGLWFFAASAVISLASLHVISMRRRLSDVEAEVERERKLKLTEREGRIKLQQLKRSKANASHATQGFRYNAIGVVESVFRDRRGTPRQPILVTASRGRIKMFLHEDFFRELRDFSHIWVLFDFHVNTNNGDLSLDQEEGEGRRKTTPLAKIKPPRLGGRRVGCLSTRSPHRPNAIGLSVCRIEAVTANGIEISGLDMVDGTPVLDVKPYIPYDILPFDHHHTLTNDSDSGNGSTNMISSSLPMLAFASSLGRGRSGSGNSTTASYSIAPLSVPSWVCESDIPLRPVTFSSLALAALKDIFTPSSSSSSSPRTCSQRFSRSAGEAQLLIEQVLAQDIRGIHQGRGEVESSEVYECVLDQLHIAFVTLEEAINIIGISSLVVDNKR